MIKIVTDSVCDLPLSIIEENDITIVPLHFHFGNDTYTDMYDLTHEEFFEKVEAGEDLPTTSQVNPPEFKKVFQSILDNGDDVFAIMLSSKLSGTCQSAFLAAKDFPEDRVKVMDSRTITLSLGLLVLEAAKLAKSGTDFDEIINKIEVMRSKMQHYILIGNIEHLRRGGRLSASKSFVANMMNIKPLLTVDDEGKLVPFNKYRGMKKAMAKMIEMIGSDRTNFKDQTVGINYCKNKKYADIFENMLRENFEMGDILIHHAGSVISTHAGPDCVAVYYLK